MTAAFISYSHADEKYLERLHKHLAVLKRDGALTTWTDHAILAGEKVHDEISVQLEKSQLFLALLSADYLASNYCYEKEFKCAEALAAAGRMRIVPIILEPCEWLETPFKEYAALPKDGEAVSGFTNQNNAYLNVATGLRRLLEAVGEGRGEGSTNAGSVAPPGRRPRIKQDFDAIQRSDYADNAFNVIREYFRRACAELNQIGDTLRAKFEEMDAKAFTCSVVNRAKRSNGDAHITVHRGKNRSMAWGDISFVNESHAERNTSNGSISVSNDEYQLFLTMDPFGMSSGRDKAHTTPEQAAEKLWNEFVARAGIEYE